MKRTVLFAFVSLLLLSAATADAYDFKLLNGMDIKGKLVSFRDGVFNVETEIGSVAIESDKLDYIIVEKSDPGPSGQNTSGTPGISLNQTGNPVMLADAQQPEPLQDRSVPAPLQGQSISMVHFRKSVMVASSDSPDPLQDRSVPAPLQNQSVTGATGTFRGSVNR